MAIGQLAAGRTAEQILTDFSDVEPEDILAALAYAAEAVLRPSSSVLPLGAEVFDGESQRLVVVGGEVVSFSGNG